MHRTLMGVLVLLLLSACENDPSEVPLVELWAQVKDPNPAVREAAVKKLGRLTDEEMATRREEIWQLLQREPSGVVRFLEVNGDLEEVLSNVIEPLTPGRCEQLVSAVRRMDDDGTAAAMFVTRLEDAVAASLGKKTLFRAFLEGFTVREKVDEGQTRDDHDRESRPLFTDLETEQQQQVAECFHNFQSQFRQILEGWQQAQKDAFKAEREAWFKFKTTGEL